MPARGHSFAIDAAGGRAVVFGRQPGFFALGFGRMARPAPLNWTCRRTGISSAMARSSTTAGCWPPPKMTSMADAVCSASTTPRPAAPTGASANSMRRHRAARGAAARRQDAVRGQWRHPDASGLRQAGAESGHHAPVPGLSGRGQRQAAGAGGVGSRAAPAVDPALAVAADGAVWFGCQYMGPAGDRPALVGRHRRGRAGTVPRPGDALRQMRNYIGSVAVDAAGAVVATSSPWAGRSCTGTRPADAAWARPPWRTAAAWRRPAPAASVSSGLGAMLRADAGGQERPVLPASSDLSWDNHFRRVPDVAAPRYPYKA